MSEQRIPIVVSALCPVSWQTATSVEIDEALKAVFQLGRHSFDVDVTDLKWREVAKRLNHCAYCEGKGEMCSAASGTELVCDACQKAHKGCSLGIAYQYQLFAIQFGAPLSWARQQFESRMAHLNSQSYNSYHQPPSFFTSLEEAIQHIARSTRIARPNDPLSPSADCVGPPGRGCIVKLLTFQSSPTRSDGRLPCKLGTTVLLSAAPPPSTLPPTGYELSMVPPFVSLLLARAAAEGKRAVKANWEEDLREQEQKEKKARHHKRGLDAQQRQQRHAGSSTSHAISPRPVPTIPVVFPGGQGLPPTLSPPPHKVPSPPPAAAPTTAPSPALPSIPPEHSSTLLEQPGLDGAAYSRAHLDIASGCDPAMTDLWDAYGDSQWLNPIHPVHWEPLPPMPVLRTNNVGALQQELSNMQRRLNSSQLDLETEWVRNQMAIVQTRHLETQLADLCCLNSEQERMLKNCQVEYEMLKGEVRALADSAAASAASAAQAKAYKALVVPGYPDPAARIEDLEGILACSEVELRKSEEGCGVAVDRAICHEVEIGNTSQLIHNLLGTFIPEARGLLENNLVSTRIQTEYMTNVNGGGEGGVVVL
ncbi:hypothetical protein BT96DRAFT_996171 [Gymnopus androsaceus JB14]|uniref:Uncharacterized protein n=1 Tax=Gymnopus androsaceus JB14 TaxID=1447944 RepID=A0A6A4HIN5_9AGAR|nr:hypothetical protein BT96DRAFT_996171 [Gymnopus androsaceus JB14]